ncbi:class I SAM-dependent methyltransferase [Oscillatoria sp. FACHB-1407]|uniref:class I SAM-dependent methyltransferase n=1 Tax=Oscillatoria sp. FACHB-1407 TaxID=2692847 RepID=UPI00168627FE|nr:class I SAM-dependent methyltransferase [Oscillatoria sp. FACHB-1407]MBD2460084.1 class I SAM-dependent methyltransferase [Oscillatoria sp. FACHB-1407]
MVGRQANLSGFLGDRSEDWQARINTVAQRFNREYRREPFELPAEVEDMPIYREWASGALAARIASPFWEISKPLKQQRCLDVGCGVSFLIYPWREWDAFFYGQDVSTMARDTLNARGPQLNSKLFKGVQLGAAHELKYDVNQFDQVIATGFSCYYPLSYWQLVLAEVKRVLKPDGVFVFDVLSPEAPDAENWAILETYLGAEVFLESLSEWQTLLQSARAKVVKTLPGELFQLYKVKFV